MSLKQAQKIAKRTAKAMEDSDEVAARLAEDQAAIEREEQKQRQKKKAMFFVDDDDDDDDEAEEQEKEEEPEQIVESKTKSKKKKKKNKKKDEEEQIDPELKFLNQAVQQNMVEKEKLKGFKTSISAQKGYLVSSTPSVITMDRKMFSYKREMKQLFADSASQFGALGLDEDNREERKQANAADQIEAQMEGASKKQKRRMAAMAKQIKDKQKNMTFRKYLFVQPNASWPRPPAKFLTMEVLRTKPNGTKVLTFKKSPEYEMLQKEFKAVQATMDIQNMFNFLQRNFYHHESLLSFADFLRLQGKFTDAFEFLERAMFAFEYAFCVDFAAVQPGNAQQEEFENEYYVPQVELDQGVNSEPLNTIFGDCLVKYIDVLGRKGCSRTALEYCKLLFGLNPRNDTHGALLRIDYYAIRAREFEFLVSFVNSLAPQVYEKENLEKQGKISSIKLMPNLLMTQALALKNLNKAEESKSHNQDIQDQLDKLNTAVQDGHLHTLFSYSEDGAPAGAADMQIILALLLYPQMLKQLLLKIAKKQISQSFSKSWFEGYQKQSWKNMLQHDIFDEPIADLSYEWIVSDNERAVLDDQDKIDSLVEETASKVFNIFIERTGELFQEDETLMWMREVIGYTLNKIDSGDCVERDLLVAQLSSGIVENHFAWSRYRMSLKTADFMDNLTVVAPQDLMGGGQQPNFEADFGGGGVQEHIDPEAGNAQAQQRQAEAEAQINQMINQLHQPVNPMMQQPMGQGDFLIQEGQGGNNMSQEEFEQMQAALVASMTQDDGEIIVGEDDDEGEEQINPGMMQQMMGMFGYGAQANQEEDEGEEENKDRE